jgi:hypothetical protein
MKTYKAKIHLYSGLWDTIGYKTRFFDFVIAIAPKEKIVKVRITSPEQAVRSVVSDNVIMTYCPEIKLAL